MVVCQSPLLVATLEIALSTKVYEYRALVLELVDSGRLGSRRCQGGSARELLVEEERADFSRERQILDGSPAGHSTLPVL